MKKLIGLTTLLSVLLLAGCGSSKSDVPTKEIEPVVIEQPSKEEPKIEESEPVVEQPKVVVKNNDGDDHPHDGTEEEGHDEDKSNDQGHDDIQKIIDTVTFSSSKNQTIDGYDITIKHKDDIHAGDTMTRTISVTKDGAKIDGFETISGDLGVGIVRDPVAHDEHLHPLANTNNSLTFSAHTHDAGDYKIITQFQHNGKQIVVPYMVTLDESIQGHGH